MNISELFIRRPVMTSLIMLAVILFGVFAYRLLPVNDLPNVDYPSIQVSASLPGASPETMASAVATPLERELSTIAGLEAMSSTSGQGSTQISLQFALERDIDAAAQDVQSALAKAGRSLPRDMSTPPSYRKDNPADSPVLYLALHSPALPLTAISEYADTIIAPRISMLSGVSQVQVFGAQKYAVRVQLDPGALASKQLGIDEVADALAQGNVNLPAGVLSGKQQSVTLQAYGQLINAAAYQDLIVAYRNGAPVRLEEIAQISDSVENDKAAGWYNETRAVVLAVRRQPGTNTIEVVDRVKGLLPAMQAQMPASVDLDILYDRSVSIRDSVAEVKFTLVITVCLVVMVIFLFLRNLSSTVIPSLALPLSLVGTFAGMYLLGFSVNNISLMALTLSVGYVVDDAIVMLENIVRHTEKGEAAMDAALRGSREIGFTILAMTLSLVTVFLPVLFMQGMLGRLLHEFAVSISLAILISGFVSLSLTPMLCSRFLRTPAANGHGRAYLLLERFFTALLAGYEKSLRLVLRFRLVALVFTVLLTVFSVWLFTRMPTGLLPSEDTGAFRAITEGPQDVSFEAMVRNQQILAKIVKGDPNVEAFMSFVGAGGSRVTSNSGFMFIRLKPRDQRKLTADQVIQALRPKVSKVPGINMFMQNPPPIRLETKQTKSMYQYVLQSPDTAELYRNAQILEEKMRELTQLQDVTSDLQIKNPQVDVRIDRDQASALGITAQQIEEALYSAYGTRQVSTIYAPTNQYRVIMELEPRFQTDPESLSLLYVRAKGGRLVPLGSVAEISRSLGPLAINHVGQSVAVTLSFNVKPGVPLSEALSAIEQTAGATLPATISTDFQGAAKVYQAATRGLILLLLMAILVIYIVLGILYESYIHPLTILSGLPAAGVGALLTLLAFGKELDLYAFVGVIMLVGIVKKNAIMMIDFALEAQRREGRAPIDAIFQGCMVRFRPIMMTTMAALMGILPIALGFGTGADARRSLGLAVVGGLLVSQVLTLYITPVVYYYMDRLQGLAKRVVRREPSAVVRGEK